MGVIVHVENSDLDLLVNLWEASVRATHHFLKEEDIHKLKSEVANDYLPVLNLRLYLNDSGDVIGFLGTHKQKVEMLFIDPQQRGKGVGKKLMKHAMEEMSASEVDVNEQNPSAIAFYEHLGFKVVGRSEYDGQGRQYPILHMRHEVAV